MSAKARLAEMADGFHLLAVEAHAEGMALIERSARLKQLSKIATEAEAQQIIDTIKSEGLFEDAFEVPAVSSKGGVS